VYWPVLETLGLDAFCEEIYLAMLADPSLAVAGLARRLGRPEADIRAGLDRLADLTLLRPSREVDGELRAVHPARGLAILVRRQEEALELQRRDIESSREALTTLMGEAAGGPATSRIERLEGLDAVQARLEELTGRATREVMTVVPGGPQRAAVLDAARPLDAELARRGLRLRSLYQDSLCSDRANMEYVSWLAGLGVQVRTAPLLPPRMILLDQEVAVMPLDPANRRPGAALVREPGVLAALIALFEQNWEAARPLPAGAAPAGDTQGLTEAERVLLRMLSRGLTDEAAASRLGVSVRTVQRRMESLMSRLGAASRFEAGFKAASRDWLLALRCPPRCGTSPS
jgi:DNA-binding CsgD family transcriptional regulator